MPKLKLQDMVKIKSARKAERVFEAKEIAKKVKEVEQIYKHTYDTPKVEARTYRPKKSRSRFAIWSIAGVAVCFLLFSLSFFFASAKVSINPKINDVNLSLNFSAAKDAGDNVLPFDMVVLSGEESMAVQSTGERDISVKAKGRVIVYNNFNSSPQPLAINTRLEGSNGRIYKTTVKTTVPGKGKDGIPGKVEVGIEGDAAGADFNSTPLDFTISGFKGTPKYSKFYGRSKGEISGGWKGKASVVSDSDRTKALATLHTTLETKLREKAESQIPQGFIIFKDAVLLNTENPSDAPQLSKDKNVNISIKGTLYGFLFDEKKISKKIAQVAIPKYDGSDIYIKNIRDLSFHLITPDLAGQSGTDSVDSIKNISFTLTGQAKIVGKIEEEKFLTELVSRKKSELNKIMAEYQNVESATVTMHPFWRRSLPEDKEKIHITVNYPQ